MNGLVTGAALLYPLVVYAAFSSNIPSVAAALLGAILALKSFWFTRARGHGVLIASSVALIVMVSSFGIGIHLPASSLYYPVMVSALLMVTFSVSLAYPPTIIERFARAAHGDLPPQARSYCRKVCVVWTLFFCVNLLISLDSTRRDLSWWTLYNGLLSYLAIAIVFSIEYLIRRRVMRRVGASLCLVLALAVTPAPGVAAEQPLTAEQLSAQLKTPKPFRARFIEQRHVAVLTAPLEATGEIECIPGEGIVWRVLSPVTTTSVIKPSGVTIIEEGDTRREMADQTNISATLLSLMSGEIEKAREDFIITIVGTRREWTLTLTPKDTLVAQVIARIVVTGRERPTALEVIHANSDRIVTTFSAPSPLSLSEVSTTEAILDGAS